MKVFHVGVVGCGHWGPNHVRNFAGLNNVEVSIVCDRDPARLERIREQFPAVATCEDYRAIFHLPDLDAVVIATPLSSHYPIARDCLEQHRDVLCEKPLAGTVREAEHLVELCEQSGQVLMVGHVFLFNAGIRKVKKIIDDDDLGRVYYLQATRTNLGPIRSDANVVWDLACHDVAIFDYLLGSSPVEVTCRGGAFLQDNVEDAAFLTLSYPDNVLANIYVSWLNPQKVRRITIVGDKQMVTWDDLAVPSPVTIFERGVIAEPYYDDFGVFQLLPKEGDITIPKIQMREPLRAQSEYFIECLSSRSVSIANARSALQNVRVMSAAERSMKLGGAPVAVNG